MIETLDAGTARRWAVSALSALGRTREEIDALNVYPVPDGDTGTNLFLTIEAACAAARRVPPQAEVNEVVEAFAHGALLGARGSSGVIVAQLLRGWADTLAEGGVLDAVGVKGAFARADRQAWTAVAIPVEGTILSVSRAATLAAAAAPDRLCEVISSAARAARTALAATTGQLAVLRDAGVVDAGGRGLVVLFDTLDDLVHGRLRSRPARGHRHPALPTPTVAAGSPTTGPDGPGRRPGYEVMYLVEAPDEQVPRLRGRLAAVGESLVVVGGAGLWHVHVHTDDAGAVVEAGLDVGRPRQIRITHLDTGGRSAAAAGEQTRRRVGLVACAAGPGLADLFIQAGAVVVHAGPGDRPSTGDLLDAVARAHADSVVVLPNDSDTLVVAQAAAAAARQSGVRVTVLPTRAQVQGLAAAAVHDPARSVDDDVVRMSAAAGAARDGAVTVAARDAITTAGLCRAGDVLGVVQGDFAVVGRDLAAVAIEVLDRLLSGGGELVTIVAGRDADSPLVEKVTAHLRRRHLDVEVCVLDGGQSRYVLLVGVE